MLFGVTSTHSSSRMNSSACSSESGRGGIRRTSLVRSRGAHVRQLLLLRRVHVEVVGARVLADDHPLVELVAGRDEERAALLEVEDRERGRRPAPVGDEAAGRPRPQLAVPRLPALEDVVEDPGAARLGEELGAEADQAARRDEVLHARPAGAVVDHLLQPPLAQREQLRDDADVLLGDVDRDALDRLVPLAVDLARQHLGLADGQLEALAAHQLDEHGELQLAAALHLPRVRARWSGGRAARRCRRAPASSRALTWRAVSRSPSVPASGDVLIPIVIESDGSSTVVTGSGRGSSGSAIVSPIVTSGRPASATISPGPASSAGTRSSASVTYSSVTRAFEIVPSARHHAICAPLRSVPWRMRQSASRPTYGSASRFVTSACSGCSGSYVGRRDGGEQRLERAARGRARARRGASPARPARALQ